MKPLAPDVLAQQLGIMDRVFAVNGWNGNGVAPDGGLKAELQETIDVCPDCDFRNGLEIDNLLRDWGDIDAEELQLAT